MDIPVFVEDAGSPPPSPGGLVLDIDGFEGPLDLLLALAREQKVDLAHISILELADQYLLHIAELKRANLELAADYLVMAAWLAFLKSRLLLPEPPAADDDQPSGEEMAAHLAFQLRRLEAMRWAGESLLARPRLGRDIFARGAPEGIEHVERPFYEASLNDLLKAYADVKRRDVPAVLTIEAPDLYSVDAALLRLSKILGVLPRWSDLEAMLPEGLSGLLHRSALSSHLVAALELVRQGRLELRQDGGAFGPIRIRPREGQDSPA